MFAGTKSRCLVFRGDALEPLGRYRCEVSADQEGRFPGLSATEFDVNDPPYNGTCELIPCAGV